MAGILISPSVEQKIRGKKAALRLRNGSGNVNIDFKNILRQRCRLRVKERRAHILSQLRGLGPANVQQSFADILREEYAQFVTQCERLGGDLAFSEEDFEMPKEALTPEEEWLMMRFDNLFEDELFAKIFDEVDQVVCPLCMKGNLTEIPCENILRCNNCMRPVSLLSSLQEIRSRISHCMNAHSESTCCSNINFFVPYEENTQCLYAVCSDCSYFDIVG